MKRSINVVCLIIVMAFSELCGAQSKNVTMSGVVTDKKAHALEGARVTIIGNKAKSDTTTDSDGAFVVSFVQGVEEGQSVRIQIEKDGYKPYDKWVAVSSTIPLPVSLEPVRSKSLAKHNKEPDKLVPPSHSLSNEETERRNTLLANLVSEYVSTHSKEIAAQFPRGSQISNEQLLNSIPSGWINHRLYELGESWVWNMSDELVNISNKELRQRSTSIITQMRTIQSWHDNEMHEMDTPRNHELKSDKYIQAVMQLQTGMEQRFGRIRKEARNVFNELQRRVGVFDEAVPGSGFGIAVFQGTLAGASPLYKGAYVLEILVDKLPNPGQLPTNNVTNPAGSIVNQNSPNYGTQDRKSTRLNSSH